MDYERITLEKIMMGILRGFEMNTIKLRDKEEDYVAQKTLVGKLVERRLFKYLGTWIMSVIHCIIIYLF
jgi:hypothetical protein